MTPRRPEMPPAEAGFALIEVLVSAVVIVVVSAGTFGLLQAMTRASGEQRHGSQAFAIAQEDQARLRSMQLIALSHLDESRTVTLAGTTFTVRSTGVFVNNKTTSVSCVGEDISADYAQVTSVVTWPGMASSEKSVLRSIVSPSNNSIDSTHGTLTASVTNEKGEPKAGVDLKAGIYSAETNAEGCATFPDLPQGSQTLESNGEDAKLVSPNSIYVEKTQAGVGAGATKTTKLIYDSPGTIPVKFKYRVGSTTEFKPSSADSVVAFHSVMKEAKVLWTLDGTRQPVVEAFPLFPFTSSYSVYAGSCTANNPGTGAGQGSAVVPAGKASGSVELQLPALEVTVKEGSKAIKGAKVTITDKSCKDPKGNLVKRIYTTNLEGKQFTTASPTEATEPGIPWGSYEVCASATVGGQLRRKKGIAVTAQSLTSATTLTIDLNSGTWESKVECT
jgi:Tfp pilus assembly protein PilV